MSPQPYQPALPARVGGNCSCGQHITAWKFTVGGLLYSVPTQDLQLQQQNALTGLQATCSNGATIVVRAAQACAPALEAVGPAVIQSVAP